MLALTLFKASCAVEPWTSSDDLLQEAEDVITDLQKELFKAQGINGGWGIECLGQVGDTYQDDTDFMKLFVTAVERWVFYTLGNSYAFKAMTQRASHASRVATNSYDTCQ